MTVVPSRPEYHPSLRGTGLSPGIGTAMIDRATSMPVAVVTESMARVLWSGRDTLTQCFSHRQADLTLCISGRRRRRSPSRSIVDEREFMYFIPHAQYR